jgi:hypothetical protein
MEQRRGPQSATSVAARELASSQPLELRVEKPEHPPGLHRVRLVVYGRE